MATKKGGGTAKNITYQNPQFLGIKLGDGQTAKTGMIIVRQRGTKVIPGKNVGLGKDHTIFALKDGTVKFRNKMKTHFDGRKHRHAVVDVVTA